MSEALYFCIHCGYSHVVIEITQSDFLIEDEKIELINCFNCGHTIAKRMF